MKLSDIFGNAKWIGTKDKDISPIIRDSFILSKVYENIKINIIGLGGYILYINGKKATDKYYLPLNSDFEPRKNYPAGEVLSHRIYSDSFEISHLLKKGKNTVTVILGDGWYSRKNSSWEDTCITYGNKKLIYRIFDEKNDILLSGIKAKYNISYVKECNFLTHEIQDYTGFSEDFFMTEYDDSKWKNAVEEEAPNTEYYFSDCPRDSVSEKITPVKIKNMDGSVIYDAGKNLSGIPLLRSGKAGQSVTVLFSEELDKNGALDMKYNHGQRFVFTADKEGRIIAPSFVWFGFRYFSVSGNAEAISVYKIHSDVKISSSFNSNSEILNWIYGTYLNTQLCNMHEGIPSDCPHIERKGYTGDGQLCAKSAMLTLDAKEFYKKWISDISDCQDRVSGHVQYTAPYTKNGGGPGGWGIAIVNVPIDYYIRYGDINEAKKLYPQMLRFFDYLEAHSQEHLVTSDIPGAWCLGEWCTPGPVILPAPFVNNYFYIKGLTKVIRLAELIGKDQDIPYLEKKLAERKSATTAAYFNTFDSNFIGNVQGANAFALDIGLGNEKTKKNFIDYYKKNTFYDTGIFGTEIVTRLLFEYGEAETSFKLLTSEVPERSFGYWKNTSATTFREEWGVARSNNHPMFGAIIALFYEYILGINQEKGSVGYKSPVIKPLLIKGLTNVSGSIETKYGKIEVEYNNLNGKFTLNVNIPDKLTATVILPDKSKSNVNGKAVLTCDV